MKLKKTYLLLLLFNSLYALSTTLDFECDQVPGPLKIDCPNDEFFSLGFYPGSNLPNPESYSNQYQWAADYMNFPQGWYFTKGTSRISILDTGVTVNTENSTNLRSKYSGTFASVNEFSEILSNTVKESECEQITPYTPGEHFSFDLSGFDETWGSVNDKQHHIDNYPDVFINQLQVGIGDSLEIAIKDGIDLSNFHIEISNHFNENSLLFSNNDPTVNLSIDDFKTRVYSLADDFSETTSSAYGYHFFYINDKTTSKPFNINFSQLDKGTVSCINTDANCLSNLVHSGFNNSYIQNMYSQIKYNNKVIMNADEFSGNYAVISCSRFSPNLMSYDANNNHGSMVLGILGASSNNVVGTSSYCRDCLISYSDSTNHDTGIHSQNSVYGLDNLANAITFAKDSGNQIISYSGGVDDQADCQQVSSDDLCDGINIAYQNDIVILEAAGNNLKSYMQFPANNNPSIIGVAGTNPLGELWSRDDCPILFQDDFGEVSPIPSDKNHPTTLECGSSFSEQYTKFAAPSEDILVYHPSGDYNPQTGCVDSNFFPSNDGYQRCSGTSFSTPILASIVAMIRSINPLISVDDIKQVLWDSRVEGLTDQRYAIPQADKSVTIALGQSNNFQIVNRLTPMFRMKTTNDNNYPNQISYLSTTIPQIANAARSGTYLVRPEETTGVISYKDKVSYKSDNDSPLVNGYSKFSQVDRAPFYVFGGHRNPFNNEADDLLPLHHMARSEFFGGANNTYCSELADHAYSTERDNGFALNNFCSYYYGQIYSWEGIEGYLLPTCPNGVNCYETTGNANDAQCLKLRYSTQDNSFALMMASEVNKPMFQSYGTNYINSSTGSTPINSLNGMSNAECLGYVFPNVDSDSDGIIDGMELVLGTSPSNPDTDNDGVSDGDEYPLSGIPQSDPLDPLDPSGHSNPPCEKKICSGT